jgi:3-oxoacyl-[acyl-carrier-protein] synthase II
MGVVTPVGVGADRMWASLAAGTSGIREIDTFDTSEYPVHFAGLVDMDTSDILNPKEARRMSRFQQMAMVAADEAMREAGLTDIDPEEAERAGVIVGSGIGGLHVFEEQTRLLIERGPSRVSPFFIPMMLVDLAPGLISIRYGLKGPNWAPVSACATGTHAIGEAFETIRLGKADIIVSGGFDAGVTQMGLAGFCAARALSTRNEDPQGASRPFDAGRDGFVMGEGGAVLVLEEWEHAVARGAHIRAEVIGYGESADAYHITSPHPEGDGARRSMLGAFESAGIGPADVDYVNAHGTSTQLGDAGETLAIKRAFGATVPPVSSTKSMMGHLLGGAGAVEAAACILAMENSLIPPTINYTDPDPACDLDYVPNVARPAQLDVTMSNSFGFGGHDATVILRKA